jgi:hypothetical protein
MIPLVVGLLVAVIFQASAILTMARSHRQVLREYRNRETDLINRVMHMKGATWVPPPVEDERPDTVLEYEHVPEPEM